MKTRILLLTLSAFMCFGLFACDSTTQTEQQQDKPNVENSVTDEDKSESKDQFAEDNKDETVSENNNTNEKFNHISTDPSSEALNNKKNENEKDSEEKPFESKLLSSSPSLSPTLTLVDGNIVNLDDRLSKGEIYEGIDPQMTDTIKCNRFLFMKDGSIIDLSIDPAYIPREEELSAFFLNKLNKTVGIKDIRPKAREITDKNGSKVHDGFDIYTNDGTHYWIFSNHSLKYLKFNDPILNDGTLKLERFPETLEWKDIVDFRECDDFVLGLTSDGKLLSSGIDFNYENIVMFDIWPVSYWDTDEGFIPVALTSEGRLIFGDISEKKEKPSADLTESDKSYTVYQISIDLDYYEMVIPYATKTPIMTGPYQFTDPIVEPEIDRLFVSWEDAISVAETFTDVVDFTYKRDGRDKISGPIIYVKKSDGSIWATRDDNVFNHEYVNAHIPLEDSNNGNTEKDDEPFESKLVSSSPTLSLSIALIDGVPKFISGDMVGSALYDHFDAEQIIDLRYGRFVFRKDGTVIDLHKENYAIVNPTNNYFYPGEYQTFVYVETFLTELNLSVGIKDIRSATGPFGLLVYAADGSVYSLGTQEPVHFLYLENVENSPLNPNGTITCEQFPETAEWTDIVDFRIHENFVLGLTSEGKLLSAGIDFEHENIAKFSIWNTFVVDIPIALTTDGRLIFADPNNLVNYESLESHEKEWLNDMINIIKLTSSFTDVVDYVFSDDVPRNFLIKKADNSLWSNENYSYYASEYINQVNSEGELVPPKPTPKTPIEEIDEFFENIPVTNIPYESKFESYSPSLGDSIVLYEGFPQCIYQNQDLPESINGITVEMIDFLKYNRFLFLKDGTIIDLGKEKAFNELTYGIKENYEPYEWNYRFSKKVETTEYILNKLNKTVGIKDIRNNCYYDNYLIYTADGSVYKIGYDSTVKVIKIEDPVLCADGKLNCPQFPETAEWTNIVDYKLADNFILALTSDGKLLSSGIDFEHENIVMFEIYDIMYWDDIQGDFAVALTSDGKLIFGDIPQMDDHKKFKDHFEAQIEIAKSFTDVADFSIPYLSSEPIISIRKKDGSIWSTKSNGRFNSEYVNFPNGMNISSGEEEIEAELFCGNCETIIPSGMSECPECGAQ